MIHRKDDFLKVPEAVDLKAVNKMQWELLALIILCIAGGIITDAWGSQETPYSIIPTLFFIIAMATFAFCMTSPSANYSTRPLEPLVLEQLTLLVKHFDELKPMIDSIKAQNREPIKEENDRILRYVNSKEESGKRAKALQAWNSLWTIKSLFGFSRFLKAPY